MPAMHQTLSQRHNIDLPVSAILPNLQPTSKSHTHPNAVHQQV
jgi:hypothetical protein